MKKISWGYEKIFVGEIKEKEKKRNEKDKESNKEKEREYTHSARACMYIRICARYIKGVGAKMSPGGFI